jgi:hypothetical protein
MRGKILVAVLAMFLATFAQGYFIDGRIDSIGQNYKGYDEILSNITVVGYNNQTYYLVSYTRNLQFSGSIILDGEGNGVTDSTINRAFFAAEILHQNYPAESTSMYTSFSGHYTDLANSLSGNLSADAKDIASLMGECASTMSEAIASFSPDAAGRYLQADDQLRAKMILAQIHLSQANISVNETISEYQESLNYIYPQLEASRKNLNTGVDYMTSNAESKIIGKHKESEIDFGINAVIISIIILVAVGVLLKKKNLI